jgi:hypothetical protein
MRDICPDDTFDAGHGCPQLRLFSAPRDECGFQPLVLTDGDAHFVTAVLDPAERRGGKHGNAFLSALPR